jgi:hypothetical protein
VALVRERTIRTERPPFVGEVSANFFRIEDVAWSAQRIPTVVNLGFLDRTVVPTLGCYCCWLFVVVVFQENLQA